MEALRFLEWYVEITTIFPLNDVGLNYLSEAALNVVGAVLQTNFT
jgi:hypothetical protein